MKLLTSHYKSLHKIILACLFLVFMFSNLYSKWTVYDSLGTVSDITQDSIGTIWISASQSIYSFDGFKWIKYWWHDYGFSGNNALKVDKDGILWVGTSQYGGILYKFDGKNWVHNIGDLPYNTKGITSIAIDSSNNLWLGTGGRGIIKFDGKNSVIYDKIIDTLEDTFIADIEVDKNNFIWALVQPIDWFAYPPNSALIKFDGKNWSFFTNDNSGFQLCCPTSLAFDSLGNIWVGSDYSIQKFDGKNWITFNEIVPGFIRDLEFDVNNNLWIGTMWSLYKFDGVNLIEFNTDNSPIPDDDIRSIFCDKNRIWVGTLQGLSVYEEDSVNVVDSEFYDKCFSIFPNPADNLIKFSFLTTIYYDVKISISNYMGNTVKEFSLTIDELQKTNEVELDVSNLASGLYFATIRAGELIETKKFVVSR